MADSYRAHQSHVAPSSAGGSSPMIRIWPAPPAVWPASISR
jgi:hypothetical protein